MLPVLIILAAAALSGCASAPSPPANVTATPEAISPVPVPTPVPLRSGSLFDTGRLQWFEYRLTPASGDKAAASDVRFDYTTATISGITVRDQRVTMKMANPDMEVVMDKYYDQASGSQVGSRVKTSSGSATLSDLGVQASDLYSRNNIADACTTGDWPLKDMGTEAVTVNGKSYSCTKYAIGDSGEHGTAWVSDGVPVPVKLQQKSDDGSATTWELAGWG